MFGNTIGPGEIAIVLVIALLIFGPKKLPELGKGLGRGMRDFKRAVTGDDEDERKDEEETKKAELAEKAPEPVATVKVVEPSEVEVEVQPTAPAGSAADESR
ncbi:MAG: sec-independent protein translocase protein TatA [Gaiellaceae bacterium]|jgi:sec-independent protein translocase protein TatA|nr:sec-independent protein translocase protein TatA [Gaiellaceae bacterium]